MIQRVYQLLAADEVRYDVILTETISALEEGRSPIVLSERKDHLAFQAERLRGFTPHLVVPKGGSSAKQRREALAALEAVLETEERLVIATGRYIGKGFDDARLDTLFLTMLVSWRGTHIQYAGRLHRSHPGKVEVRIYDYVDDRVRLRARCGSAVKRNSSRQSGELSLGLIHREWSGSYRSRSDPRPLVPTTTRSGRMDCASTPTAAGTRTIGRTAA